MRQFKTGATRDSDNTKQDPEAAFSPIVFDWYLDYIVKHRKQANGSMRPDDNWQKGMPMECYIKSAFRHFLDVWKEHRGFKSRDGMHEAICGLLFNVMGYAHEYLKLHEKRK